VSLTIATFRGAGYKIKTAAEAAGTTGTPMAIVTPSGCNPLVIATGHDSTNATPPVPVDGQVIVHQFVDRRVGNSYWVQRVTAPPRPRLQ